MSSALLAQDVSQPAMLQWFEVSQATVEKRTPDLFSAGYGSVWLPPQSRADDGSSAGYNVYDRFDLGKTGDPTLYGTETRLKSATSSIQRAGGGQVYLDFILNHAGLRNETTMDGSVRFSPSPSNPNLAHGGGYPGFVIGTPGSAGSDFHAANVGTYSTNPDYDYQYRLAGLLDIDQRTNNVYVRNPVPGFANNIPNPANATAFGRQANVPTDANRRFYTDQQGGGGLALTDPRTGGSYTQYTFNAASPSAGDPVAENAMGYLMRNAQWLVQSIGADGFRLDAVKHVYPFVLDYYDRSVFRADRRLNLDGSVRNVFAFGEYLDGDRSKVQTVIRKDITSLTTVGGNRDALDFPLFFAMRDNLSSTAANNNWHKIRNASQDVQDDGLNNGSQGVAFVSSHDDDAGAYLRNVAYAFTLMRPGRALVYTNGHEFGTQAQRPFPKEGQLDALGGFYGNTITKLTELRNTHGRGNFSERWVDDAFNPNGFSNVYVYERQNGALVALNSAFGTTVDVRTPVQTSFAAGTHLVELTGNAADPQVDVNNSIPETLVVNASGQVTVSIPRNGATAGVNKGYVIYGLQNPKGSVSLSNVASTIAGESASAANNGTQRLSSIDVVTANSFTVTLNTTPVTLSDGFRDRSADGSAAYVRIDSGIDVNNTGTVDFRTPGSTKYGFENFTGTNAPGYNDAAGFGTFAQSVNTTNLSEGYHYVTARAFRQRSDGGPDVYTDFRKTIYVDRLKPVSAVDQFVNWDSNTRNRDVYVRSTDQTATSVQVMIDVPANRTDAQILADVGSGSFLASQVDRDQFKYGFFNVATGNHAFTIVTREVSGNYNVQRIPGVFVTTNLGAGLGDLNFDGVYGADDVANSSYSMEVNVYPLIGGNNTKFNAAADFNADGLMDSRDLYLMRDRFEQIGAPAAAITAAQNSVRKRGDMNGGGLDVSDINDLYAHFGNTQWKYDLDVDGWPTPTGADQQDMDVMIKTIFRTRYGDANLDGVVNFDDYVAIDTAFNTPGSTGWENGDFNGDGVVNFDDYVIIDINFNQQNGTLQRAIDYLSGDDRSESGRPNSGQAGTGVQTVIDHFDQFGVGYAQAFLAAVPEPVSLLSAGAVALATMIRRPKRRGRAVSN